MSKEIALDLRRYTTREKLSSLPFDTASLAIEAATSDIPRVNPHFFVKTHDGQVIAPGRDKRDVELMFDPNDPAAGPAKEIINHLKKDRENFAYVWISAPGPWPEARLEIGAKKRTKSGRADYIKAYGISTSLDEDSCLRLGQLLVSISPEEAEFPISSSELRSMLVKLDIPSDRDPFEYLSTLIDLPEKNIFESILDGSADKNKAKALKAAVKSTKPVLEHPEVIYSSPISYGAYIETRMGMEGFEMDPARFGCGASNKEFSTASGASEYNSTRTDSREALGSCQNCHTTTGVACGWCKMCWEAIGKYR